MKCIKCGSEVAIGKMNCPKCGTVILGNTFSATSNNAMNTYTPPYGNSNNMQIYNPMPYSNNASATGGTGALVFGILTLISDLLCCVMPLFAIVSITFGVLAIVFGNNGIKENGSPKARTGKVLGIVGLCLLVICVIIGVIVVGLAAGAAYYDSLPWYEKMMYY